MNMNTQKGFTLIELMIALVLGLLISAAAVQVYITNYRTSTVQKSGGDLQNAGIFGVQQYEYYLRHANLDNPVLSIDDKTIKGGIVMSADNVGGATGVPFTKGNTDNGDLVIQYTNIKALDKGGSEIPVVALDCEGATVAVGETVIQHYYLDVQNGNLMCDAGRINYTTTSTVDTNGNTVENTRGAATGMNANPAVAVAGAEKFAFLLGTTQKDATSSSAGLMAQVTPTEYMALANKPAITSVKTAILVRGSTPIFSGTTASDTKQVVFLGKPIDVKTNHMRHVFDLNTILRNARVIEVDIGAAGA